MNERHTLLLVEDEYIIAMGTVMMLKKAGYEVDHVATGEAALDLVRNDNEYSLVLMDIDLGSGMDGIETAQQLIDISSLPVLFVSSHDEPEYIERTEKVTAFGYVQKSAPPAIFLATIRMALRLYDTGTLANSAFTQAINGVCFHRLFINEDGKYDCEYLTVNPAFTKQTGVKASEVVGETIRSLFPGDDRVDKIIDLYKRVVIDKTASNQQEIYFEPSSDWYDLSIFPIRGNDFTVLINNITEKKVAQDRYRIIVDKMSPGIVFHEKNGSISSANAAAQKYLGLSLDQLQGKTPADPRWRLIDRDGKPIPPELHNSEIALATGKISGPDDRGVYIPERDEYEWLSVTAVPIFKPDDEEGRPSQAFATFDRITDRVRAEDTLYAEKERYRVTLDSIGDAVLAVDLQKRITHMNPVAQRLSGYTLEEAQQVHLEEAFSITSAVDGMVVANPIHEVLRTGRIIALANHTILTAKDGTEYQIADSAAPIIDVDGDIAGAVLVFRDVTAEYERTQELRRSERLLNETGQIVSTGGWEVDIEKNEVYWTQATKTIYEVDDNYDPQIEKAMSYFPGESGERLQEAYRLAREEGKGYDLELDFITEKGNKKKVRDIGKVDFRNGKPYRVYGIFQDITEIKKAEDELNRAMAENNLLMQEVQHRVKNLMTTMSTIISIQMQTAMAASDTNITEVLKDLQSRFKSMAALYNHLYKSQDRDRIHVYLYLNALVPQITAIFPTKVNATIIADESLVYTAKTVSALGLIITELITNAMKYAYSDNEDPKLLVSLTLEDGESILIVQDNGPGLPEEAADDAFGTSLVIALAQQLHGTVLTENDNGAKITIRF